MGNRLKTIILLALVLVALTDCAHFAWGIYAASHETTDLYLGATVSGSF